MKTSRVKRRRTQSTDDVSQVEILILIKNIQWHVLTNDQVRNNPLKKDIMLLIRSVIHFAYDTNSFEVKDPFSDISSIEDIRGDESKLRKLKNIIGYFLLLSF